MVGSKYMGFFDHMKPVEVDLEKKMLKELKKIPKCFNGLHCSWIKCLYIYDSIKVVLTSREERVEALSCCLSCV